MLDRVQQVLYDTGDFEFEIYFRYPLRGKYYKFAYVKYYDKDEYVSLILDNLRIDANFAGISATKEGEDEIEVTDTNKLKRFARMEATRALCDMEAKELEGFCLHWGGDLDICLYFDNGVFELLINGEEVNDEKVLEFIKNDSAERL